MSLRGEKDWWLIDAAGPSSPLEPAEIAEKDGVWLALDNIWQFIKTNDGNVDAGGTRDLLGDIEKRTQKWKGDLAWLDPTKVRLTLEMGVPQLNAFARSIREGEIDFPIVSFGDMYWSVTLGRSLHGAGEYDQEVVRGLALLEGMECPDEVWLLPLAASDDYKTYFARKATPCNWLDGLLGPGGGDDKDVERIGTKIRGQDERPVVVVSSGKTGVWNGIYRDLCEAYRKRPRSFMLVQPNVTEENDGRGFMVVDGSSRPRLIPQEDSLLPLYACADLGLTRGGITATEFAKVQLPFILCQETNHFLSGEQQRNFMGAGLAHGTSLLRMRDPEQAFAAIEACLDSPKNEGMVRRMRAHKCEAETQFAAYLLELAGIPIP